MRNISNDVVETFDFSLIQDGYGVSGVDMKIYIQRVADGYGWNDSLQDWNIALTQNTMTEVSATNFRGLYRYTGLPVSKMTFNDRYNVRYYNTDFIYGLDQSEVVGVCLTDLAFEDGCVHCNTTLGVASTTSPYGRAKTPTKNIDDAVTIADANNLTHIKVTQVNSNITLTNATAKLFEESMGTIGTGYHHMLLLPSANSCLFKYFYVSPGHINVSCNTFDKCRINSSSMFGATNVLLDCIFDSSFSSEDGINIVRGMFNDTTYTPTTVSTYLKGSLYDCQGNLIIDSLIANGPINVSGHNGKITINALCSTGTIKIYGGSGTIITAHTGTCTVYYNDILIPTGTTLNIPAKVNDLDGYGELVTVFKDILFNRTVLNRHSDGKPQVIAIGTGGLRGTVTTTQDGYGGKIQTEILS
jgi:hypothetical protein